MFLLEKDITKKKRFNKKLFIEPKGEFKAGNNKDYKVKAIINNAVYDKETNNQIPGLYYLVL